MPAKTGQKRADDMQLALGAADVARRGRSCLKTSLAGRRTALPTMHASARRCLAMRTPEAAAKRKSKRSKRAHNLGGRLASAIRAARLRATRAAEDYLRGTR